MYLQITEIRNDPSWCKRHHHHYHHHHLHQGLYSLSTEEPSWIDPTGVCAWLILTILTIKVRPFWWDRLSILFLDDPAFWSNLLASNLLLLWFNDYQIAGQWPAHLCFPFLIALMIWLTPSFLTDPGVSLSISKGNAGSSIMIALFSVHVSQQYVITGKMYSSCIFLFILMLALRLLMMLFTSPRLPNQVRSAS